MRRHCRAANKAAAGPSRRLSTSVSATKGSRRFAHFGRDRRAASGAVAPKVAAASAEPGCSSASRTARQNTTSSAVVSAQVGKPVRLFRSVRQNAAIAANAPAFGEAASADRRQRRGAGRSRPPHRVRAPSCRPRPAHGAAPRVEHGCRGRGRHLIAESVKQCLGRLARRNPTVWSGLGSSV